MNFEKQDARLGLLVLVALGLFLGLVAYKNAGAVTERSYPLVVHLDQMEGLAPGTDVQLKGYRVGSVLRVDMRQEGKDYHFLARIAVREDIKLWRGTRANLSPKGVGSVMLDLRLPELAERTVLLTAGDEIPGDSGVSIAGVLERADHLMASLQAGVEGLRTRIERRGLSAADAAVAGCHSAGIPILGQGKPRVGGSRGPQHERGGPGPGLAG